MKATLDISTMITQARNPELKAAEEALKVAQQNLKQAGDRARETCTHPFVIEYPYYSSDYGSSLPPYRICAGCGFREQGWGCGYHALQNSSERTIAKAETREHHLATEPERISGWWIKPVGRKELPDPYKGYADESS